MDLMHPERLALALTVLDYGAVGVFGAAGALAAARKGHDIITFAFFAAVTGVGGGTLRDLLIGAPVFWVQGYGYILATLLAAIAVWFLGRRPRRYQILLWLDALGMAAYCVVGAAKALSLGVPPTTCVVMGVLTAAFGGVVRDVLAGEPSVLLSREIYITAALLGAAVFVVLSVLHVPFWPAGLAGFSCAFILRAAALRFHLAMPGFPVAAGRP